MTRCSHAVRDHICTLYFLTPSFVPKKSSPSLNLKLCFVLEGSRRVAIFGAGLVICFIADFSNSQFSLLRPPPTRRCSPNSWNVREIPRICICQIGRFSTNRGASGIRGAGHVPPSPDFRPFALSFVWEFILTGFRLRFSA